MIAGLCEVTEPPLVEVEPGHMMSCHIPFGELGQLQRKAREAVAEGGAVTLTSVAPDLEGMPPTGGGEEPPDPGASPPLI